RRADKNHQPQRMTLPRETRGAGVVELRAAAKRDLCNLSSGRCPVCGRAGEPTWHRNCKGKPKKPGWGDALATILKRLGIRPTEGCGCRRRQRWLNQLGRSIERWWGRRF